MQFFLSATARPIATWCMAMEMEKRHSKFRCGIPYQVLHVPVHGTEVIPGKHSDARIKPLPLTNGHGRYMAVIPERTLVSVGEWPLHMAVINLWPSHFRNGYVTAVLLVKPCGGLRSETATWIQK
jgi:hypothetical protein